MSDEKTAAACLDGLTVERRVNPIGIDALRPRFAWRLVGAAAEASQAAFQIQVVDTWDSGRRDSAESTYVVYDGPPLRSRQRYTWRVRVWCADGRASDWSPLAWFEMGLLAAEDWSARWIAHIVPDLVSAPEDRVDVHPAPLLRRRFSLPVGPHSARAYITALGVYEAFINGAPLSDQRLAPGWTDYHTRIQYQTYDVTRLLREGPNVLAVRLANGWFAGRVGALGDRRYGDEPRLLCQLEAHLPSGEVVTIASDADWRATYSGTWLHDLQMGERTDFRTHAADWATLAYDDQSWRPASLRAGPGARLVASRDDGIHVVQSRPAETVQPRGAGRYIVDLGANAAGVVRVRTTGQAGQRITLRHAEALDADGELYTDNLRGAEQQDEFILAGAEAVTLEPHFTFHGFRYVEIHGIDGSLDVSAVESRVLSSATRLVGAFSCSDPRVEQLQRNIVTSLRANFISVPTDCPQRNERLGWTADLQIFAPTALFNADVSNLLLKWLDDLVDGQLPSGAYPDIAPCPPGWSGAGNTAWADAGVIVPWVLFQQSGDVGVLERMYVSMQRYMLFLEHDQTRGLRFGGRYGDWVSLGAHTDKLFIGTAYLAYVADLFARIAAVLGIRDDEQHFAAFATDVRDAFRRRFVGLDGTLTADTQTAYALALGFGLVPEHLRSRASDRLAALVESAGTHLATGFLGTPLVLPALSDNGHHELACRLMQQDTYPSWLFAVGNGATSIWERWNGWTPEHGFYSPRMNSFNHYAFGAVGDWLYRYLAGLKPVEPGYRRVELHPRPGADFTAARATHESLYGLHTCGWTRANGMLTIEASVPANTSATLVLPSRDTDVSRRIELGPGAHAFEVPYP